MTVSDKLDSIAKLVDVYNWLSIIAVILFIACLVTAIVLNAKMKQHTFFTVMTFVFIVIFAAFIGLDMREHSQLSAYDDQIKYFYQRTNIQPEDSEKYKLNNFEHKLLLIHENDERIVRKIQQKQKAQNS